jgi:predicted pyridoxine 5'-phosphate oxidase superfamily flavin-nucleotide-binding protein
VLDPHTIAFVDYRGNKQYITSGNLVTDDRMAMIFMDYPSQTRLKVLGHAERLAPEAAAARFPELAGTRNDATVQYVYVVKVVAFDWNCQQHITPRYTEEQIERATAPLQQRLAELEAENERLKAGDL